MEDWATICWVNQHPPAINRWLWDIFEEYERPAEEIPSFESMWKELGRVGETEREIYDVLSKFAHPKSTGLRWVVHPQNDSIHFHAGSNFSRLDLDRCLFFLIQTAQLLLNPVANVRKAFDRLDDEWVRQGQQLSDRTIGVLVRLYKVASA